MSGLFLNSGFLVLSSLVAAPIVIHLINRLRYRRVRFAAMEFLLISQQKNRRRVLLEQLLLLLIRILIVLLIVFLVARMILNPGQGTFVAGKKTHHIVLLDDSVSMQEKWQPDGEDDPTTAFDQAKAAILRLVKEGAKQPGKQTITLIKLSEPQKQILEKEDLGENAEEVVSDELAKIKPTSRALSLDDGMKALGAYLKKGDTVVRVLHVVSDFRDRDWGKRDGLVEELNKVAGTELPVNLVRAVPVVDRDDNRVDHSNLTVNELTGDLSVATVGIPLVLKASVTNHGTAPIRNAKLTVFKDGKTASVIQQQRLVALVDVPEIPPGRTQAVEFSLPVDDAGWKQIKVRIADDALAKDKLAADDERFLAVNVTPGQELMAIDGDKSIDNGGDFFVWVALGVEDDEAGLKVRQGSLSQLREALQKTPERFSCIYLMDVPAIEETDIELLKKFVEGGGGLVWYVGKTVSTRADFYNRELHAKHKLFPIPLAQNPKIFTPAPQEDVTKLEFDESDAGSDLTPEKNHPIFRRAYSGDTHLYNVVKIYSYIPVAREWNDVVDKKVVKRKWEIDDGKRKDGVKTIARLRNGEPFIFESRLGKGRILAHLTSCGTQAPSSDRLSQAWTNWPLLRAPFVAYQSEIQAYVARDPGRAERLLGSPLTHRVPASEFEDKTGILLPGQTKQTEHIARTVAGPAPVDPKNGASDPKAPEQLEVNFTDTERPGVYQIVLKRKAADPDAAPDAKSGNEVLMYAYNVPSTQSDLTVISDDELQGRFGKDSNIAVRTYGSTDWLDSFHADRGVRYWLLVILGILMILEMLLAYRLSYHPANRARTTT